MKRLKTCKRPAFTLIEMLVVVAIIAIIAAAAAPGYNAAILSAKQTKAMNNAKQISLGLRMYSNDNDGAFPSGKNSYDEQILTSNDAFRSLLPTYIDNETVFTVPGSKAGAQADNKMEPASRILERGENHWAYVSGLTNTSNSNWPLIVDHTDGSGYYTKTETNVGGTWKGTKGIMVRVDGSAVIVKYEGTGDKLYFPKFDEKKMNALDVASYMGSEAKLLEPAR